LIVLETIDLRAIIEEGHDFGKDDITQSEQKRLLPVKRVHFDSSAYSSDEDDYIDAFKETEAKPEKKREPAKYSRSSTRPAPGTVKKLMTKFQNP
jgi:hypothetical protein